VFLAIVCAAGWSVRIADTLLNAMARRRWGVQVRRAFVSARWWGRKAGRVLQRWSNRLRTLDEAGKGRCLRILLAVLVILVTAAGALAVMGAVEKYQESCREQEKQEAAQRRRHDKLADKEERLAVLGIRRSDFNWNEAIAVATDEANHQLSPQSEAEAHTVRESQAKAYSVRGVARCVTGEWEPAIADLTEAIRLNYKDARAYRYRGFARCLTGEWEPAIADLSDAIRLNLLDARAYAFRSLAHAQKGDVEKAKEDREHAKRLGFTPDEFAQLAEVLE
jgi:tetratricopeptide (TPR) repeat protein